VVSPYRSDRSSSSVVSIVSLSAIDSFQLPAKAADRSVRSDPCVFQFLKRLVRFLAGLGELGKRSSKLAHHELFDDASPVIDLGESRGP
jgi:hypothetical protein